MTATPETLLGHELIGLAARVVGATNPDLVGIEGRVVDETLNTLVLSDGRTRTVPKRAATFEFELPDGDRATVEGEALVARPARRTETAGGSIWQ